MRFNIYIFKLTKFNIPTYSDKSILKPLCNLKVYYAYK